MVVSAQPEMKTMRERVKSLKEILEHAVPFKPPIFEAPHKLMKKYGEAVQKGGSLSVGIQRFAKRAWGVDVILPTVEPAGVEVATMA